MAEEKKATIKDVRDYFAIESKRFALEWRNLTAQDKEDLKAGLSDGTLSY